MGGTIYAYLDGISTHKKIGDATFVNVLANGSGSPSGVTVTGFNRDLVWGGASNLGATPDANALESIMSSIIWSNGLNPGAINAAVTAGLSYKLQLLFSEGCCNNRHFDVSVEGALLSEINGTANPGGAVWHTSSTQGYALTKEFVATDSILNIGFNRNNYAGDTNYHISGFTLERIQNQVPEPASLALLGLGLAGLGVSRRRK